MRNTGFESICLSLYRKLKPELGVNSACVAVEELLERHLAQHMHHEGFINALKALNKAALKDNMKAGIGVNE